MITTTLNKIRAHQPCEDGWKKLLAYLGKTKADDEILPLTTVLDSNGLDDTLWCLRCAPEHDREWRLYAVWCARQVQHLMTDQRSLDALDMAEKYAHGEATDAELAAAWAAAWAAVGDAAWDAAWAAVGDAAWDAARAAAWAAARAAVRAAAWAAVGDAAWAAAWAAVGDAAWDAARAAAWAAVRDAAGDAAWDAVRDAAWDAAWDAQTLKLREILETS